MNSLSTRACLTAISFLFLVGAAFPGINFPSGLSQEKSVPAGEQLMIDYRFIAWHEDCRLYEDWKIEPLGVSLPKNGTLTFKTLHTVLVDPSWASEGQLKRACEKNEPPMTGVGVFFTPDKGFTGKDTFKIRYKFNGWRRGAPYTDITPVQTYNVVVE